MNDPGDDRHRRAPLISATSGRKRRPEIRPPGRRNKRFLGQIDDEAFTADDAVLQPVPLPRPAITLPPEAAPLPKPPMTAAEPAAASPPPAPSPAPERPDLEAQAAALEEAARLAAERAAALEAARQRTEAEERRIAEEERRIAEEGRARAAEERRRLTEKFGPEYFFNPHNPANRNPKWPIAMVRDRPVTEGLRQAKDQLRKLGGGESGGDW